MIAILLVAEFRHTLRLAREYGISVVMTTGMATRRIHTGQIITVDGSTGTVTLKELKI